VRNWTPTGASPWNEEEGRRKIQDQASHKALGELATKWRASKIKELITVLPFQSVVAFQSATINHKSYVLACIQASTQDIVFKRFLLTYLLTSYLNFQPIASNSTTMQQTLFKLIDWRSTKCLQYRKINFGQFEGKLTVSSGIVSRFIYEYL